MQKTFGFEFAFAAWDPALYSVGVRPDDVDEQTVPSTTSSSTTSSNVLLTPPSSVDSMTPHTLDETSPPPIVEALSPLLNEGRHLRWYCGSHIDLSPMHDQTTMMDRAKETRI